MKKEYGVFSCGDYEKYILSENILRIEQYGFDTKKDAELWVENNSSPAVLYFIMEYYIK